MSGNCAINFHRYHFNKILVVFRCFGEIEKLSLFLGLSGIFTGPLMVLLGNMGVFLGILGYSVVFLGKYMDRKKCHPPSSTSTWTHDIVYKFLKLLNEIWEAGAFCIFQKPCSEDKHRCSVFLVFVFYIVICIAILVHLLYNKWPISMWPSPVF
jgi:hypothetical protein